MKFSEKNKYRALLMRSLVIEQKNALQLLLTNKISAAETAMPWTTQTTQNDCSYRTVGGLALLTTKNYFKKWIV